GPHAARQHDEGLRQVEHHAFACVHAVDDLEIGQAAVAELGLLQVFRDDTDDLAAGRQRRVRHGPHEADSAAAIDETYAVLRERAADIGSNFEEGFGCAVGGAAIDANRLDDLTHFQSKGPSPWPFFSYLSGHTTYGGKWAVGQVWEDSPFGPGTRGFRGIPATVGGRPSRPGNGNPGASTCDFVL